MKSTTIENSQILIGAFFISFFINGCTRLSSILFPYSLAYYNVDRNQASFPFTLCYLTRNLIGPLVGYLGQIFGIQNVIMTGCVLSALSIAACYFSKSILTITILWGVGFGASLGLAVQVIPVILNNQFPKDKSKANNIFFEGSGLGSIILPILFEYFLHNYGMSGSFLLLGALMFHCIPAGLLLNNHSKSKAIQKIEKLEETENSYQRASPIYVIDFQKEKHVSEENQFETIPDKLIYKESESNTIVHKEQITKDSFTLSNIIINKDTCAMKKRDYSFEAFKIFIDPVYIEILLIQALSSWVVLVFWTIILDVVRDKGVEKQHEIYFVICLPMAESISRLISGYTIDKLSWRSSTTLCLSCVGIAFSLLCFNFASSYALLFITEIMVSFLIATIIVEQVVLVHEFIERKNEMMGMSCRLFMFSPCIFTISPMIGYFRGNLGSYDYIIYIMSGVSLLCACITYTLPYLSRRQNRK